jgi:hypothetical protein
MSESTQDGVESQTGTENADTKEAAKTLSSLGASKGGHARAESLSAAERSRIAREAVQTRWRNAGKLQRSLHATHKGNFEEHFGFDVDCYVLDDEARTAVISQRGMGETLGYSKSGSRIPRLINGKNIAPFAGPELTEKLENPLIFLGQPAGPNIPPQKIHGYDVTILIDICKAILAADVAGKLTANQKKIAQQARIIVNASAKAGVKGLVYALAGYDATKEEVIAAFKLYVREEAREYEKEFPDQLYEEWYRLYQLPKPERNKPWKFKSLTVEHVYRPLARSNGQILKLTKVQRQNSNVRSKKLHQFLSEIGVKALRTHLGQLLGIARISRTDKEYEGFFERLFADQPPLFDPDREQ